MLFKKLDNSENISLRLFIILRQLQEVPSRSLIIMKSKTSTIFRKEKIELETTSRQCRPQQFRQEQRNYLFKSPNHNPGFLRNFSILTPYELKNFSSFVPIHC